MTTVSVDLDHGARITTLRDTAGREWLWQHPNRDTLERRAGTKGPGSFVDAGGIEECFPTVSGDPDHGEAWSTAWQGDTSEHSVRTSRGTLTRRITQDAGLTCTYQLLAPPGTTFVWALHALLRPDQGTQVFTDGPSTCTWDSQGRARTNRWPWCEGADISRLGEDDGSAMFVLLPRASHVTVVQPSGSLEMLLLAPGQPYGIGLWRNLGGYSWDDGPPYRSFGVEPMIGDHPDRSRAGTPGRVGQSGSASWQVKLTVTAFDGTGEDTVPINRYDPKT